MSVKVQDYNETASTVLLAALGPDGKPALLPADKPAGVVAEKYYYDNGQVSQIDYFSSYDPATQTGELAAVHQFFR